MAQSSEKKNIFEKLYANKKIFFLVMFLILLPIVFLSLLYILRYNDHKDIYFDKAKTENTVYITEYSNFDDLPIVLEYKYKSIEYNAKFESEEDSWFSKYTFEFKYTQKEGEKKVTNVGVQVLLHADMTDYHYLSGTSTKTISSTRMTDVMVETSSNIKGFAFFPYYTNYPAMIIKVVVDNETFYLRDLHTIPNGGMIVYNQE